MGSGANAQVPGPVPENDGYSLGNCSVVVLHSDEFKTMQMALDNQAAYSYVPLATVTASDFETMNAWNVDSIYAACGLSPDVQFTLTAPSGPYDETGTWGINLAGTPVSLPVLIGFRVEELPPEGDKNEAAEISQVIVDAAARSLQSTISANRGMVDEARDRFIESGQSGGAEGGVASRNDVDFDVDGTFAVNDTTLSTSGTFFQQTGNYEGTQRRLFFGDFDVQHDGDTSSTTATLTGRMAWEQMVSDSTMMGYFIGGELAYSNIDGVFEGDQDRIGVTIGTYAVHQLAEQVYLDGFLTFGAGRNNLEMANDVLELESDYTTRTATIGAALSGVYDYGNYGFRPELAFSYGHTWIGNVGFTSRADGLVDDTLSLDAGDVSIANLTLRPEMVWALDGTTLAKSNSQLSFAPRLICEIRETVRRTENCGGGAEFGLSRTSEDGLSTAEFRVSMDRVGDSTRSSLALNLQHRF
jgi:hypothetical protein